MCNQFGQAYQINLVMHLRSDSRQTWLQIKFYQETLWGEQWILHFISSQSACLDISRPLLAALWVFSAIAARDSGQSDMILSVPPQGQLIPFVGNSPWTHILKTEFSELCLPFKPSFPGSLVHFQREFKRTVIRGFLMFNNLIKFPHSR